LWIKHALATPIFQNLILQESNENENNKKGDGADLFGTHEVWKTYAALWNNQLDDFTQVPTHIVDVE
jgi:hypothetical protein